MAWPATFEDALLARYLADHPVELFLELPVGGGDPSRGPRPGGSTLSCYRARSPSSVPPIPTRPTRCARRWRAGPCTFWKRRASSTGTSSGR